MRLTTKAHSPNENLLAKVTLLAILLIIMINPLKASQLELSGEASMGGRELPFTMTLSEAEGFINQINGFQSMQTGFDGQSLWRIENGAGPFNVDFSEKEIWTILHWMLSGYWLEENAPIVWTSDLNTGNAVFRLKSGRLELSVPNTLEQLKVLSRSKVNTKLTARLPEIIRVVNLPQELTVSFVGQQQLAGRILPKQVVINGIGEVESFDIKSAELVDLNSDLNFSRPPFQLSKTSYDDSIPSEITIKQADTGHIFVKPFINGEKVGWFLFDSGAGGTQMSAELVNRFDLKRVAKRISGGIGGSVGFSDVYQGGRLRLGPLTITDLNYKVYDPKRSMASGILGEPVVGVLGWDILTRSVVEVDMLKAKMWIHNSAKYRVPAESREQLYLHWKVPYVKARFSTNHEGIFMLDTGAGKGGIFFPKFSVDSFDLLKGKERKQSVAQGAGGKVPIVRGTIDWFEIAGHKTENVPAIFSVGEDHEADIFSTGFLGGAVIKPFKVVFDYGRNEVGFIRR